MPINRSRILIPLLCLILFAAGAVSLLAQESRNDTVRFLEQATFGPTPALITRVEKIGFRAFLDQQFAASPLPYPDLPLMEREPPADCPVNSECRRDNYTMYPLQVHFFNNALYGEDQLRQRVAWALSQILVTSSAEPELSLSGRMRPYQQLLYSNAFGNYRQLLYDIALKPAMGRYLDMVGNRCYGGDPGGPPNPDCPTNPIRGIKPNENFAREILQLFSISVYMLNPDGTPQRDPKTGGFIFSYDNDTIEEFAKIFTGWVFAVQPRPGVINYVDPMVLQLNVAGVEIYHDRGPKNLLNNFVVPACPAGEQCGDRDLNMAIDNIFNHPNVGPFIGKLLIQNLVTSNPSPAYVANVTAKFNDNGSGVRGDLKAVVEAVLLDPEARGDNRPEPNYGKLREPVQVVLNLLRMFNAASDGVLAGSPQANVRNYLGEMDQTPFGAPTVFNFYQFDYQLPGERPEPVFAPEFGIFSSITALRRANFINTIVFNRIPPLPPDRPAGTQIDLSPLVKLAGDPAALVAELDTLMMHGAMSQDMRDIITNVVSGIPEKEPERRAKSAVYLVATSSQYQVER